MSHNLQSGGKKTVEIAYFGPIAEWFYLHFNYGEIGLHSVLKSNRGIFPGFNPGVIQN